MGPSLRLRLMRRWNHRFQPGTDEELASDLLRLMEAGLEEREAEGFLYELFGECE